MNIAMIGFGVVGQGFAEILRDKANTFLKTEGFDANIVAVTTNTRGSLYDPNGLDIDQLIKAYATGSLHDYPDTLDLTRGWDNVETIERSNADVIVEVAYSDLQTGMPAIHHCQAAFNNGRHVILANKGPVALAYHSLQEQAQQAGVQLRYEATVMAGTPSIRLATEMLRGCEILGARGILNGSTNYMLTRMEAGLSYDAALREAQAKGYMEADPSADIDGWDAAGKVVILSAALFGKPLKLSDLRVEGIRGIDADRIQSAMKAQERWRLIASVTPESGSVAPMRLPLSDPLAGVFGTANAITYTTDLLGDVTLVGPGAGKHETGYAILADLIEIRKHEQFVKTNTSS